MKIYIYIFAICLFCSGFALSEEKDLTKVKEGKWVSMFDGKSLDGWKPFTKTEYSKGGKVEVKENSIHIAEGFPYSYIQWKGKFPKENYEVFLRTMKPDGNDIFCGILFPVGTNYCSLVLGGWGNSITGLSCIDNMAAADNEYAVMNSYTTNKWYKVTLRVTGTNIMTWVGGKKLIDVDRSKHEISPYFGLEMMAPFGVFTFGTPGAFEEISVRRLEKN